MKSEKAYRDLVNVIKELYPNMTDYEKEKLEDVCPELTESDDERIRKKMLSYFKDQDTQYTFRGLTVKEVIDWLEKQKPVEKMNGEDYGVDGLYAALDILETTLGKVEGYQSDDGILEHKAAIAAVKRMKEQKPIEWSEEDKEKLDRVIYMMEQLDLTNPWSDCYDWLKSLKPNHWKPSEEQMKRLQYVIRLLKVYEHTDEKYLEELFEDLKKL